VCGTAMLSLAALIHQAPPYQSSLQHWATAWKNMLCVHCRGRGCNTRTTPLRHGSVGATLLLGTVPAPCVIWATRVFLYRAMQLAISAAQIDNGSGTASSALEAASSVFSLQKL
jgi:hypothetical protein